MYPSKFYLTCLRRAANLLKVQSSTLLFEGDSELDLSKYYTEICREPILKKEEEFALFERFKDPLVSENEKKKIRDRIIRANMRFAFNQAKKYSRNDPGMFEDLISAANEGLLVGFEKFNPSREVRFLSYVGWWVNQRILKAMSKMRIVDLPIWKQQLASRIQRLIENNEKLTLQELFDEFPEVAKKDIKELYQTRYLTYYIDDMNEDEFEIDPIGEDLQKQLDDTKVWKAVASLPSPHREVIARCFGLEDDSEHSPARMSKALKIPKEEIQKIKAEGLNMLREKLGKKEAYLNW